MFLPFVLFHPPHPHASPCRVIIDGASVTISAVTPEDQGIYACSAQTELDNVTAVTQVTILDVPDPPEHLSLSERQNRSVRLTWEAGDDHNSDISEYIVERRRRRRKEGKRREKKEKNLRAGVGAIINTQDVVYQDQISFYRLETLPVSS